MIAVAAGVKVLVATKPVDFRNYAERTIMRSPRVSDCRCLVLSTV
jgi:hypothetical protein